MALVLAVVEAIQVHLILVVWLQASGHDPVIVFWHLHHLRLPILIFVLTRKWSIWPLGMVQESCRKLGKDPVTTSCPRSGSLGDSGSSMLGSVWLGVSSTTSWGAEERDQEIQV